MQTHSDETWRIHQSRPASSAASHCSSPPMPRMRKSNAGPSTDHPCDKDLSQGTPTRRAPLGMTAVRGRPSDASRYFIRIGLHSRALADV